MNSQDFSPQRRGGRNEKISDSILVTIQLVLLNPKNQNLRKSSLSADFADDADFKTRIQV
jgi:hypothetical protein